MNTTTLLAMWMMVMPLGDGDGDKPKAEEPTPRQEQNDPRDTYYRYEREAVDAYRDRVVFSLPPVPQQTTEVMEPVNIRPVEGAFVPDKKLVVEADPNLEVFLEKHKEINKKIKVVDGWRVQIFADRGRDGREQMQKVKALFLSNFPDVKTKAEYLTPLYRLRVGNFLRHEDAVLFCREVRKIIPGAFIVPDKVEVPRYIPEESDSWQNRH